MVRETPRKYRPEQVPTDKKLQKYSLPEERTHHVIKEEKEKFGCRQNSKNFISNGNPLQYSCLKNSMDRGAWWATVRAAAKVRHNLSKKQHLHLTITTTNKKEATNLRKHLAKKCTK